MAIEIIVPRSGWSMEEGTFAGWLKQEGEKVKAGDRLFALESDKSVDEAESMDEGILRIPPNAPKTGDRVKVGQLLGYLVAEDEAAPFAVAGPSSAAAPAPAKTERPAEPVAGPPAAPIPGPTSEPVAQPAEAPRPSPGKVPVTPRARRAAAELGVDLQAVQGSGRSGRIRERDVRGSAGAKATPAEASSAAVPAAPMTGLRRTIADRMMRSRAQTAPVTLTSRADATNLVALRNQLKAAGEGAQAPSYNDMIAKVTAAALLRHPLLAARWEGDGILLPTGIHIGIAVDTEQGLLVPVIRDVDQKSLADISRTSRALVEAARTRQLKAESLQGGVFTITNLGSFGIDAFTPIINYPEAAVLGVGAIRREAVIQDNGQAVGREQLTLSLTFDHRIVDGAPAARFLQTLRGYLENPIAWLLAERTR